MNRRIALASAAGALAATLSACGGSALSGAPAAGNTVMHQQTQQSEQPASSVVTMSPNWAQTLPVFIKLQVSKTVTLSGLPAFTLTVSQNVDLQRIGVAFFDPQAGWTPLGTVIGRSHTVAFPGTTTPITLQAHVNYKVEVYQTPAQTANAPVQMGGDSVSIPSIPNFDSTAYDPTFQYDSAQGSGGTMLTFKGVNDRFEGTHPPGTVLFSIVITADNPITLNGATVRAMVPNLIPKTSQFFIAYFAGNLQGGEFFALEHGFKPFAIVQGHVQNQSGVVGNANPHGFPLTFPGPHVKIPVGSTGSGPDWTRANAAEGVVFEK